MKALIPVIVIGLVVGVGCSSNTTNSADSSGTSRSSNPSRQIVVGFAQIGAESGWRTANTESIQSEAKKRNIKLLYNDAQQKQENQISAMRSFMNQKVDLIMFSPVVSTGWDNILKDIKRAGIPVIVADRQCDSDPSLYVTHIGSDMVEEGRNAAKWLAKKMNGKAVIAELQGTVGSNAAIGRKKGFEEVLKNYPDMKIVMSQTGEFTRAKGKEVMEAFIKNPEFKKVNALFAHNDDMALGAIQALEAAGIKPGVDIIIISMDGVKDAFKAMAAGKLNCSVECNPLLGPKLFDATADILAGKKLEKEIFVEESVYDQTQAANMLPNRKY
jgi:simple sugar transport system substrate-binding protein